MTVEKVVDKNEPTDLQNIKQQIESLATIMKSTRVEKCKTKGERESHLQRRKRCFEILLKKAFQGSPWKGKGISKPGQKPIKCYRCDGWGHGWKQCPTPETLKWRELVGAVVSSNRDSTGSIPNTQPRMQTMISKALKQRDLYHNPDPLGQLVGEANESKVIVEGQETRALLDSGSQLSAISWTWVKKLKLEPKQLQSILRIEGSGGLEVPYLGYVEV